MRLVSLRRKTNTSRLGDVDMRAAITRWFLLCACLPFVTLAACSSGADDEILVMAAASLTDAFEDIEVAFEAANPGIGVQLNLAGSATLREQILQGAPADVFVSANTAIMDEVVASGAAAQPQTIATNQLVIAVPVDNPAAIDAVTDLSDPDLLVGLCAVGVPCGDFAAQALDAAGVVVQPDTFEGDVRALLTKIEVGELDAGVVYRTDATGNGEVAIVELPQGTQPTITYPIAVLADAPNPSVAQRFNDFVLSVDGQTILAANHFGAP